MWPRVFGAPRVCTNAGRRRGQLAPDLGDPIHMSVRSDRQRAYLRALGIPLWRRQGPPGRSAPESDAPAVPPTRQDTPALSAHSAVCAAPVIAGSDWAELEAAVTDCRACALCEGRTRTVFGVGSREADWMIIGEAPGAEEDRQGKPFVGRAGQLLDKMLLALGLRRDQVFVANLLKCRPPGNRDPKPEEVLACQAYLARQIALVRPRILLSVGRVSAQHLLATDTPVGRLRGKVHRHPDSALPVVVTYHPAYLLRKPVEKRKAWDDLQLARDTLKNLNP